MANVGSMTNVIMEMVKAVIMVKTIQDRAFAKYPLVLHANPPVNVEPDFVRPVIVFGLTVQNATGMAFTVFQEYVVQ
jgi:hypothetical protein